jgi:hypothetical protein
MPAHVLNISNDGRIQFVYADELQPFLPAVGGISRIARASHVEPDGLGSWWADLAPVGGPKLGPFVLRERAVAAEVEWLEARLGLIEVKHG